MIAAMDNQSSYTVERPAILAPLTPMGQAIAQAALARRGAGEACPPSQVCLPTGAHSLSSFGHALTQALRVDHFVPRHVGRAPNERATPWIWLLGSAAELAGNVVLYRDAIAAARGELRRSCLAGRILALVYMGSAEGQVPSEDVLKQLLAEPGVDALLIVADTAASGFRLSHDDAITAAGMQVELLTRHSELADKVVEAAACDARRLVSIGVARIDSSPEGIRQCVLDKLQRSVLGTLSAGLGADFASPAGRALPAPSVDDYLTSVVRGAGGRLGVAASSLTQAVGVLGAQDRIAQVRQAMGQTKDALSSIVPLRRPGFWERLWDWLRRRGPGRTACPVLGVAPSSTELAKAEMRNLQIAHLLHGASTLHSPAAGHGPWDLRFADHADGQAVLDELLPSIEPIVWKLTSQPLDELLSNGAADQLRAKVAAACDEALRVFDTRAALSGATASCFVEWAAAAASPLSPWGGRAFDRWCLVPRDNPADWSDALQSHAFHQLHATTSEVVLATILSQMTPPWPDDGGDAKEPSDANL